MSANIDLSNNRENIAFLGKRADVWHRMGQEMQPGQTTEEWAKQAGLDWEVIKLAALARNPDGSIQEIPSRRFLARNDTLGIVGFASPNFNVEGVQPKQLLAWFEKYVTVDDRFELDVAGSLKGGKIVWATAKFNGDVDVMGEKHVARLLMTTAYDSTMATINQATMTRVVCNNTLTASLYDKRAVIRTYHSQKFNAEQTAKELAAIAQGFDAYKEMAERLAMVNMQRNTIDTFFKTLLKVDDTKEVSTRTTNILDKMMASYDATVSEGTEANTAWTALNAVTRYVDNDRAVKGAKTAIDSARFLSANFGSGIELKRRAADLLQVV